MNNLPAKKSAPASSGVTSFMGKLAMLILGSVLAAFGSYLWTDFIKPKPLYVNIQVFDDQVPANALKGVAVWLGMNDVESKQTGDFGTVRFEIPHKHRSEMVTPHLKIDGYSRIEGKSPDVVVLDRGELNAIFVMKKNGQAQSTKDHNAPVGPDSFDRRVYSSGSEPSGPGASFSPWYELCSDPAPADWVIAESSFVLAGDRQCNAWSECKQTLNDSKKVCWQFRMQGHGEQTGGLFNQGNTGVQFSTGVLNVLWKH